MDIINVIDIVSVVSTSYRYSVAQLIIRLHLTAVVTDGVAWSVGLSVCHNMAQPIEMLFGVWSWVGPGNRVLDGGTDPGRKGAVLRESVICTANGWLKQQDQQFLCNGIRALEKCQTTCILVAVNYVEK